MLLKSFPKIVIVFLLGIVFSSCNQDKEEKALQNYLEQNPILEKWMGEELIFPEELIALDQQKTIQHFNSHQNSKLVIYLETGCGSCITSIGSWMDFIAKSKNLDLKTCFILGGLKGQAEYASAISKLDTTSFYIIVDEGIDFLTNNQLPEEKVYHTFLIDHQNQIQLMGSPIIAPFLKDIYQSKMNTL